MLSKGGGSYPPNNCCCRNRYVNNGGCNAGFYGSGGPAYLGLSGQMSGDIYSVLCSMSTLLENIGVALGVKIEAVNVLSQSVMINRPTGETPVHGVNLDLAMGNNAPCVSGQEHNDGH